MSLPSTNPTLANNSDQFNIQLASKMTGLNPHTIRAWEKRYQAVTPQRDSKGRRVYNREELSRLALLNQLVFNGHNISSIASLSDKELNQHYQALFQSYFNFDEFQNGSIAEPFNTQECLQNLSFALVTQSLNIVNHELDKARVDLSGYSFIQNIVKPFMLEAQEHFQDQRIDKFQFEVISNLIRGQLAYKVAHHQTVRDQEIQAIIYHAPGILNEIEALKSALTMDSEKTTYQKVSCDISAEAAAMLAKQFGCHYFIYAGDQVEFEKSHLAAYEFIRDLKPHLPLQTQIITVGTQRTLFNDVTIAHKQKELKQTIHAHKLKQEDLSA